MDYQTFKNRILNELQDFYGSDARVYIVNAQNDSGVCNEGICVEIKGKEVLEKKAEGTETKEQRMQEKEELLSSIMPLERLYGYFASGDASLEQCAGMIVDANREGRGGYVKENERKPCGEYPATYQRKE